MLTTQPYGAGVDPVRVPRPSPGADVHRTATALGDVAFPSNPPGRRWGAANVPPLCGHDSVSPHAAQGTCPRLCLRAKDHPEDTKVAAFPSLCAPPKVQAGSAAVFRPPRSGRPCERESRAWVRETVASKKARRTGAVELHRYAAWYGRWLLSKVHHRPALRGYMSPSGLRLPPPCWLVRSTSNQTQR